MQRTILMRKWITGLLLPFLAGSAMPSALNAQAPNTTTPIKHVVVIFQENVSFDHYFAISGATRVGPEACATCPSTLNQNYRHAFHA